jgi:osmotically-inducible protein OsmY
MENFAARRAFTWGYASPETAMKRIPSLILAAGAALAAPAFADTITTYQWDPATGTYVEQSTYVDEIIVTAPRYTDDDLITADVADRIANDDRISGRVGVETYRSDVTLTGRVATRGQADRAERDARAAGGVRDVSNLIRPSVGG